MSPQETAKRLLIALCSDKRGISIPIRKTIEEAETMIAEAITAPRAELWIARTGPEDEARGWTYAIGRGDTEIALARTKEDACLLAGKDAPQ